MGTLPLLFACFPKGKMGRERERERENNGKEYDDADDGSLRDDGSDRSDACNDGDRYGQV